MISCGLIRVHYGQTEDVRQQRQHHLLNVAIGGQVSVFIDGDRVFNQGSVEERRGTFGISLAG